MNTLGGPGETTYIRGMLKCDDFEPPSDSVGNSAIRSSDPIDAEKIQQQYVRQVTQVHGTAIADRREVIHVAFGDGQLIQFHGGCVVPHVGGATTTIDLLKNGTTILSSVITLDNSQAAFDIEVGTISTPDYNDEDVFEVVVNSTVGGGTIGQGLFVQAIFREDTE